MAFELVLSIGLGVSIGYTIEKKMGPSFSKSAKKK